MKAVTLASSSAELYSEAKPKRRVPQLCQDGSFMLWLSQSLKQSWPITFSEDAGKAGALKNHQKRPINRGPPLTSGAPLFAKTVEDGAGPRLTLSSGLSSPSKMTITLFELAKQDDDYSGWASPADQE